MEPRLEDATLQLIETAQGAADILRALANADDVSKEALRMVAVCLEDKAEELKEALKENRD